jgi:hypothetical protein
MNVMFGFSKSLSIRIPTDLKHKLPKLVFDG